MTATSSKALDMAPNAVDDLYKGCKDEALKIINSRLLTEELKRSQKFQEAWAAHSSCTTLTPAQTNERLTALSVYVNGGDVFKDDFNAAVETLGVNVSTYKNKFHFKSFHFLLMDSMKLLDGKKCKTVHALTSKEYTATKGSKVKLGHFMEVYSNYSDLEKMEDFHGNVLFNITSCFFAKLGENTCAEKDTMLLSPAEVFTVEDVKKVTDGDTEYTAIILRYKEVKSSHNCYMFSR